MFIIKSIVLLLTITGACSKIQINITVASNKLDTVIRYSGVDSKLVTGKEITLFNITEDNLKAGVEVELGRKPNDVFLRDPTPYRNLYEKYKWMEVKRKMEVNNVTIVDIISRNVTLKKHNVINYTTGRIKKDVVIEEMVENTISTTWSERGIPNDDVYYNVSINFGRHTRSYEYKNKWRNNSFYSVTDNNFGVSNVGYVYLEPGQKVTLELSAVHVIMLINVDFRAKLFGCVIANYAQVYGKYHFWAPTITNIMKAAKLKNKIITNAFFEIRGFVEPYLRVYDKNTLNEIPIINPDKPFYIVKRRPQIKKTRLKKT